ncbi:serine hydrolase domain-containing protein [Chryseobacterium gregarium]|uniref:serine hydrolase domain-containing protein n=1 Tax=Chryseobacterium gregarium TaxID=456299 RepID=UPI000423DBC4|nr:serine hydrolase domain-containing protein [Chryseobacterium gregarium]
MKKIYFIIIFNIFGLVYSQTPDYKKSIDSMLNYFQENNAFSGSILLQKNGETVYKGEFNKFPNGTDRYRIGSITKTFTSIIIFQLIEEGRLTLDTKLNTFYPAIKYADKITIGNLLNHTSGIYNYLEWEDYYVSKRKNYSKEEMLKLIQQGKPDFRPGEDCGYSNSNYMLLGYILEDITKKSYADQVKIRIADKIGLKNTYCETSETEYFKRNISYLFDGENWSEELDTHPGFTFAAGAIVSTTEDLSKLMNELFNGKLVSKNSLAQMQKTNAKAYGYGLFKTPFYERSGYGHSGKIDEFHSFTGYFPDEGFSISVLSNGTNIKLNEIILGIVSKYYQKSYKYPDFTTYKKEGASSTEIYHGVYKAQLAGLITLGKFKITHAGKNYLFLSMYEDGDNGEKMLLERKSENTFYARKNDAELQFLLDKKGKVTGILMKQGKQSIKCKKTV